MITATDLLQWTGLDVQQSLISTYETVCSAQLQADGGGAIPAEMQKVALCYLIASKVQVADNSNKFTSESLGGYSYSRKQTSSSTYWLDVYREFLKQNLTLSGIPAIANSSGAERIDKQVMSLNRRYS